MISKSYGLLSVLVGFILISIVFTLAYANPEHQESGRMVLGTGHPPDNIRTRAMKYFADSIKQRTKDRFQVDVIPAGGLGTQTEMAENITSGAQHLGQFNLAWMGRFIPDYNAQTVPFLFEDDEHLTAFLSSDITRNLENKLVKIGFKMLSHNFILPPRSIYSIKPLITIKDMEGLKFRVPQWKAFLEGFKAIGMNVTPTAWGEVYFALQTGVIDAGESNTDTFWPMKFTEVTKYIIFTKHVREAMGLLMHHGTWDKLSPKDQKIFISAANDAAEWFNSERGDILKKQFNLMRKEHGVTIIEPSKQLIDEMRSRVSRIVSELERGGLWKTKGLYTQIRELAGKK